MLINTVSVWTGGLVLPSVIRLCSCNLLQHALLPPQNKLLMSAYSLLSADTSMFPSLMRSFINLLVRSSSISWHCSRSLNSGLSRKESLNSSVGSPIDELMRTAKYQKWDALSVPRVRFTGENSVSMRSGGESWWEVSPSSLLSCLSHFFPLRTSGHRSSAEPLTERV